MSRIRHRPFRALTTTMVVLAVAACLSCGERTLKVAGEACNATSECESGLLCDFAAEPAACAGEGSAERPTDASVIDATITAPDANLPDAAPPDAAPDAAI